MTDTSCPTCNDTRFITKPVAEFERKHRARQRAAAERLMQFACPECNWIREEVEVVEE